ncbi:MAG: rhodanese-like domain-containing protein [Anaerolineae bacterium]
MMRRRLAFAVVALALVLALFPMGQIGQAQDSLQALAESYFSEGIRTVQAVDLFENLNDGDPDNDPYIISIRSAEHYAAGHVPGAVNMSVKEMFTLENLATIPPDRQVVVYCYTGQSAGQATAALNMLGYDAYSLHFGMSSWTTDAEVYASRFDPEKHANDFRVETEPNEATGSYDLPEPLGADAAAAALAYFSGGPRTIAAADLFDNLNDGDADNDPYIMSVRTAEHYALGHVPGAVNYPLGELFAEDTLATIPPDRQLVVYCYTGQSAGQATAALNMLGYEAYSLVFGMSAWTTDPDVYVSRFEPEVRANDFTIDTEAHLPGGPYPLPFTVYGAEEPVEEPAEEAPAAVTPAQNCITCHTDQAILQDLAVEEEEVVSEASSGEG